MGVRKEEGWGSDTSNTSIDMVHIERRSESSRRRVRRSHSIRKLNLKRVPVRSSTNTRIETCNRIGALEAVGATLRAGGMARERNRPPQTVGETTGPGDKVTAHPAAGDPELGSFL